MLLSSNDTRPFNEINTKRVFNLKVGDVFKELSLTYIVTFIADRIYFYSLSDYNSKRTNKRSFGLFNQQYVEMIVEKPV